MGKTVLRGEVMTIRKIGIVIILTVILCALVGCMKVVDTQEKEVEVTITDTHYEDTWTTYRKVGKVLTPHVHPAKYEVTVEFEGKEYVIDDEYTYDRYKDFVGERVTGILKSVTYDNGSSMSRIVELK